MLAGSEGWAMPTTDQISDLHDSSAYHQSHAYEPNPRAHDKNWFLSELSPAELAVLRPHLTTFEMRAGDCLHYFGERIDDVVFPHAGLVALTMPLREASGASALLIGREGIVGGFAAAASAPATCNAEVHIAGRASRMSAAAFRFALEDSPAMRRLAARFDSSIMAQAQQTALCNAAHQVEGRICRWLLEVHDRGANGKIPLTQSTIAQMLGVRRTTVTLVAGRLERDGVLTCRRGYMQIINRDELERRSCECYGRGKSYVELLFAAQSDHDHDHNGALRAAVAK
jgi:CRP-like cAMP-binding protein